MNKKTIIIVVILNILIATGIIGYIELTRTKTYYIDLQKVYMEFELKKDLEKKLEAMVNVTNQQLDSLEMQAKLINNGLQENPTDQNKIDQYNMIAEVYGSKSQQFDQQKQETAQKYDDQVWSQLNEYVKQYGKEKKCDFIIAGNGDGSIMFAKESKDITDKMIQYVNEKYQGK